MKIPLQDIQSLGTNVVRRTFSGAATPAFKDLQFLQVSALEGVSKVALVRLNRPAKRNAVNLPFAL